MADGKAIFDAYMQVGDLLLTHYAGLAPPPSNETLSRLASVLTTVQCLRDQQKPSPIDVGALENVAQTPICASIVAQLQRAAAHVNGEGREALREKAEAWVLGLERAMTVLLDASIKRVRSISAACREAVFANTREWQQRSTSAMMQKIVELDTLLRPDEIEQLGVQVAEIGAHLAENWQMVAEGLRGIEKARKLTPCINLIAAVGKCFPVLAPPPPIASEGVMRTPAELVLPDIATLVSAATQQPKAPQDPSLAISAKAAGQKSALDTIRRQLAEYRGNHAKLTELWKQVVRTQPPVGERSDEQRGEEEEKGEEEGDEEGEGEEAEADAFDVNWKQNMDMEMARLGDAAGRLEGMLRGIHDCIGKLVREQSEKRSALSAKNREAERACAAALGKVNGERTQEILKIFDRFAKQLAELLVLQDIETAIVSTAPGLVGQIGQTTVSMSAEWHACGDLERQAHQLRLLIPEFRQHVIFDTILNSTCRYVKEACGAISPATKSAPLPPPALHVPSAPPAILQRAPQQIRPNPLILTGSDIDVLSALGSLD